MEGTLAAHLLSTGVDLPPVHLPAAPPPGAGSGSVHVRFVAGADPGCDLVIEQPGWEPQQLAFTWSSRHSTWLLENCSGSVAHLNGRPIQPGQSEPLNLWDGLITSQGVALKFHRAPDAPVFRGQPASEVPLDANGLILGRGAQNKDGSAKPRLELDYSMRLISSTQAEIRRDGLDFIIINRQTSGLRIAVNGDEGFNERKLILGDCIQIPDCTYYTFKFTGASLKHLGRGGALQGFKLTVDVETGRILHEVDLELQKGTFLGIIGGSGQGKSTLMHALCGIVPATSGFVLVDGMRLSSPQDVARANIGYVPQDDIVHKELRVQDALYYSARLRLVANRRQIDHLIADTMETLRLTEHRHKAIWKLSGGQRKRVSIASELLASPDYLFLDEPTSGLDPFTEKSLMQELSTLARRKRIGVAATTHVLQSCYVLNHLAYISRGRLIFHGTPEETAVFFLRGDVPGPNEEPDLPPASTEDEFGEGEAGGEPQPQGDLERIHLIYDRAQDTTRPIQEQNRIADNWVRRYKRGPSYRPPTPPPAGSDQTKLPNPPRVNAFLSLWLLISRQWKLLTSSALNYLFLLAQALVIGVLISWVSDNIVLQLFLSVIATMWFGCSNGAQQIVAELPVFRRERLAGLGIHTYLSSKFAFLTAVTAVQGILLFSAVTFGDAWFHREKVSARDKDSAGYEENVAKDFTGRVPDKQTRLFRESFFDQVWSELAAGRDHDNVATVDNVRKKKAAPAAAEQANSALDFSDNSTSFSRAYVNPSGLHVKDSEYLLLEKLAGFFRVRDNLLGALKFHPVTLKGNDDPSDLLMAMETGSINWKTYFLSLLLLRLGPLFGAALVGVALGLAVSALVDTPTQAVMWVPLILIPQILFGSFVVTVPEMDKYVLAFSNALPSFNLQRIMDVGLIYGRQVPEITNQTKIPAFISLDKDTVDWDGQQTEYDKVTDVNKSWQNLILKRDNLGAREKAVRSKPGEPSVFTDTVDDRPDVTLKFDDLYVNMSPAFTSAGILAGWVIVCYGVACISLYRRQTGR